MATKGMSTLGMKLGYIVASGTSIPSTGSLTYVPEVKSIPNLNPEPQGIDVTPIDETEYVLYTPGLKDLGSSLEFTANLTDELLTLWNTTLPTAIAGGASGSVCWFCVEHPNVTEAIWFIGEPSPIGMGEASVNAALETSLHIAPKSAPTWGAKL